MCAGYQLSRVLLPALKRFLLEKNCFDPLPHMVKHSPPDSASFQTAARGEKTEGGGATESPCCEKKLLNCPHLPTLSYLPSRAPMDGFFNSSFSFLLYQPVQIFAFFPLPHCVRFFFTLILWLNPSVSLSISTLLQQWEILQNP